jgi:hypothetical protein
MQLLHGVRLAEALRVYPAASDQPAVAGERAALLLAEAAVHQTKRVGYMGGAGETISH